jgi:hypothetical protein
MYLFVCFLYNYVIYVYVYEHLRTHLREFCQFLVFILIGTRPLYLLPMAHSQDDRDKILALASLFFKSIQL